jgi:hypothetical protein
MLTGNPSGNRMAVLLVEIVRSAMPQDEILIEEFKAACAEIERLAKLRNQLLHGMWGVITEAIGVSRGLRPDGPQLVSGWNGGGTKVLNGYFSAEDIERVATEIGAVRFTINSAYLKIPVPDGKASLAQ